MINCFEFWYAALATMKAREIQGLPNNEGLAWVQEEI